MVPYSVGCVILTTLGKLLWGPHLVASKYASSISLDDIFPFTAGMVMHGHPVKLKAADTS